MGISGTVMRYARKHKGILKHIVPKRVLDELKERLILRQIQKIAQNKTTFEKGKYPFGVNLIGNIRCETGLGESCRLVARMLELGEVPFSVKEWYLPEYQRNNDNSYASMITDSLPYGINLIHINPFEMKMALSDIGNVYSGHYNIAFWLWELEDFPEDWTCLFSILDEIWVPSEFAAGAIRKMTSLPVKVFPYYLETTYDSEHNRLFFNLQSEIFYFLVMFDSVSTMARKNPMATIKAYKEAFSKQQTDVGMIIKINNPQKEDVDYIYNELAGYSNIVIMDTVLEKKQVNGLIRSADVLVSLHRAEGYGLPIAEAMQLGTPVIATNYSTNTEFMDKESACLIDYKLVAITDTIGHYRKGFFWAEADSHQAAQAMLRLHNDKIFYEQISENGIKISNQTIRNSRLYKHMREVLEDING